MGAWGINTFENDDAADWFAEFCDEPNEELLFDAFSTVNEIGDDYLEAPESSAALAAAEIVAALQGKPSPHLPEEAQNCVRQLNFQSSDELISAARKAIARIQTDSELKELWEESDDFSQWQTTVNELKDQLS